MITLRGVFGLALLALSLVALEGCPVPAFACVDDAECAPGFVCASGVCSEHEDAGLPLEDAGPPLEDAGLDADDAGLDVEDAGLEDAGLDVDDAGLDVEDAGLEDAGIVEDAGLEDAGLPLEDAGVEDAGIVEDAGPPGCTEGLPCDDEIPCTDDDRCFANGVCLGLHSNSGCGACDVDCTAACASCCTQGDEDPSACTGDCGPCLESCDDGCDQECTAGAACSFLQSGGDPVLTCEESTCRSDLAFTNTASVSCVDAICDVEMHNSNHQELSCTASTCTGLVRDAGGVPDVVTCNLAADCELSLSFSNATIACDTGSTCLIEGLQGTYEMTCGTGASCEFTSCINAGCTLACGIAAASCVCEGVACARGTSCAC